eukprot:5869998-Lingulodinium_polyedra.AAC.1
MGGGRRHRCRHLWGGMRHGAGRPAARPSRGSQERGPPRGGQGCNGGRLRGPQPDAAARSRGGRTHSAGDDGCAG